MWSLWKEAQKGDPDMSTVIGMAMARYLRVCMYVCMYARMYVCMYVLLGNASA